MITKTRLEDLARFGGALLFDSPRHVNKPNAPPRGAYDAYLSRAWDAGWFTNDGPLVKELEARLAAYVGVEEAVLTANGTLALDLVIRALGLTGEVILPGYTFVSSAHALRLAGLVPVFCDVDPVTMSIDLVSCASVITPRTSAVLATHVWSVPCETDALQQLCDKRALTLLYDAAHAFGAEHQGRRIGGFGRAEIFSLHATKVLHSFEGGLISTDDSTLAADLRLRRNFGFSGMDRVEMAGTNAKMSEAHAAMGLANLDQIDTTIAANRACHDAYAKGLTDIPGVTLRRPGPGEVSNHHYVVTEVDAQAFGMTRDQLLELLLAENVLARRYLAPSEGFCVELL